MTRTLLRAAAASCLSFALISLSTAAAGQSDTLNKATRAKPLFRLSISCAPVVSLGSLVAVRVRLTNTSSREMNGSTGNVKGFSGAYTYDVRDQSGNVLQQKQIDPAHQGSGEVIVLKPGQSREEVTNLSEAYDLWPGKYTIQLSMPSSSDPGAEVVKSNKITVTVTP